MTAAGPRTLRSTLADGSRAPSPHRQIDPGKGFDLTLPLEEPAEGYRAMDERRAIKTLLRL
jgi:hypothetical protein